MATKSLGQYLLEKGVITQDMLIEAIEYQRSRIKPLCDVAVKTGQANREQLTRPDEDERDLPAEKRKEAAPPRTEDWCAGRRLRREVVP